MRREQKKVILEDLKKKMVFLVGPRQVGKTWLSKEIMKSYKNPLYLNYDNAIDKQKIKSLDWLLDVDILVLDELHKMPKWKNFLKGIYDIRNPDMHILVTGSARLETFRKSGDSLAGRFFVHHLLPISLKEMQNTIYDGDMTRLIERGGFPEPFLSTDISDAKKWRETYVDSLLREDVLDFKEIEKYKAMRDVFEILRYKVGSQISYSNIANDVGISPTTVKTYIMILEALYIVYLIRPYSKKINRSILKSPKIYFYDTGLIKSEDGVIFENLIANSLQKHISALRDIKGEVKNLMYLKDKENREVDFAIIDDKDQIEQLIEVKTSDLDISSSLKYFVNKLDKNAIQVVKNARHQMQKENKIKIVPATTFLKDLFL